MNLVEVLVEQDGDLQQRTRRESRHPHPAVPLQPEERAKSLLAASRRAQLDQEMRDLGADVPQAVHPPRRDDERVAGSQRPPSPAEPHAQLPGDTLEALKLALVDVRRHEASGPHEELCRDAGRRPLAEDDALTRDWIPDCVYAGVDHLI